MYDLNENLIRRTLTNLENVNIYLKRTLTTCTKEVNITTVVNLHKETKEILSIYHWLGKRKRDRNSEVYDFFSGLCVIYLNYLNELLNRLKSNIEANLPTKLSIVDKIFLGLTKPLVRDNGIRRGIQEINIKDLDKFLAKYNNTPEDLMVSLRVGYLKHMKRLGEVRNKDVAKTMFELSRCDTFEVNVAELTRLYANFKYLSTRIV